MIVVFSVEYFSGKIQAETPQEETENYLVYPNPNPNGLISVANTLQSDIFGLVDMKGSTIPIIEQQYDQATRITYLKYPPSIASGVYILQINDKSKMLIKI